MTGDDDGDFSALLAAAVASRHANGTTKPPSNQVHESPCHPMLARMDLLHMFSSEEAEESLDLAVRLWYRLNVFRSGSARWGIVDDWRRDGSAYKRHGVIIELHANMVDATVALDKREQKESRLREAIDLVQLVIALDPRALKRTFERNPHMFKALPTVDYDDELSAVARGAPWELRLKFKLSGAKPALFVSQFITSFTEKFDSTLNDAVFVEQRKELVHALTVHEYPTIERVAKMAAHSIVPVEMEISMSDYLEVSVLATEDFFSYVATFVDALHRYQSRGKPRRWSKHSPFRVNNILLKLGSVHVTSQVLRSARVLKQARIPVDVARLVVDFGLLVSSESDLRKFMQVISTGSTVSIHTGKQLSSSEKIAIDAEGQDRSKRIRELLHIIGGAANLRAVNVGPLLGMCRSSGNRKAVWCGLFRDVLLRDQPLERLSFRIGFADNQVVFRTSDGETIEWYMAWLREMKPDVRFRVRHLKIHFERSDTMVLRTLLSVFDDVEKITLHCQDNTRQVLTQEDILPMYRYPSIHSIDLTRVALPSMDLFDPSITDPRLSTKPLLRRIHLARVRIEDAPSVSRFFEQLDTPTSELASSLEYLYLQTSTRFPMLDHASLAVLDSMLKTNKVLRQINIDIPCIDQEDEDKLHDVLRKHKNSGGHLQPSEAAKRSGISMARKTAFLSTISDSTDPMRARYLIDATIVNKIFDFSAPHATRTTL